MTGPDLPKSLFQKKYIRNLEIWKVGKWLSCWPVNHTVSCHVKLLYIVHSEMTCRSIYHVYYISLQSLITRTYILIWKARGIKQSSSFFFLKSFCIGLVWLYGLCLCQSLTRKSLVIVWNVVLLLHPYHFYVQFVVLQRYYIIYRNMSLVFAFLNTCLVCNLYLS